MPDDLQAFKLLTTGAQRIAETAIQKQQDAQTAGLCLNHWLQALLERHPAMMSSMTQGLDPAALQKSISEQVSQGQYGEALNLDEVAAQASARAQERGKSQAGERDLVAVILSKAGYILVDTALAPSGDRSAAGSAASTSQRATPTLDQFGRDLTSAAREGRLAPIVGRDEEIDLITETLCRTTKRNPVLVGPAGVGKTAIVEGLALRIVQGKIPDVLANVRLISLQPSTIIAGAQYQGDLQKRLQTMITEASQEGIILFIDEVHAIIGAGGTAGATDIAGMIKPALARGDIAVVAATTDDEYRRFIETDGALERRFQPIRIQALTPEQTLPVLHAWRTSLTQKKGVTIADEVLQFLINFGHQYMRNRQFPDKAVDLLEQCYAYAITHKSKEVRLEDAETVAQRMIGMPLALEERFKNLKTKLEGRSLLTSEDQDYLVNRLQVTLRGLDIRASRPNAVVLLIDQAVEIGDALSRVIAESLFGASDRVTVIDLSRMVGDESITLLLGAPPAYVGYSDALPIHRVAQMPWSVLRLEAIDLCHPQIRAVISRALMDGFFTDSQGKQVYLSDTVVIITAGISTHSTQRPLGFQQQEEIQRVDPEKAILHFLGPELAAQVDIIIDQPGRREKSQKDWLEKDLLHDLSNRFLGQGVKVNWDQSVVEGLNAQSRRFSNEREWERFVDNELSPLIIPYLGDAPRKETLSLTVHYDADHIRVEHP